MLDDLCKEKLTELLRRQAGFCGLEVIDYCFMSNHFHILIRVPPTQTPSDEELLERLKALHGKQGGPVILAQKSIIDQGKIDPDLRQAMLERMGDVSDFMKEFKQRFSRWYNRQHERFGTLWAERFKSVLVEDQPSVVEAVAAYIDLNPVRAGLVEDPKDYRFCGYASALAGNKKAQEGILSFQGASQWEQGAKAYRMRLFVGAGASGKSGKAVLEREKIKEVVGKGGELSMGEVLRLRIRHMTDGVALGTSGFVNEIFALHREKFGKRRQDGARPIRALAKQGLKALRDLRVNAFS